MKLFGSITELVSAVFRKNSQAITLRPNQTTTYTASRDIQTPQQDADSILVSRDSIDTLTNKTFTAAVLNNPVISVQDTDLSIKDDGDNTKIAKFQASGITTGTTRTFTFPDASDTLIVATAAQSISNKGIGISNTITQLDSLFTLEDNVDNTKLMRFQLSGITTGTTRTLTVPDADTTLVGTDATQTLSNKSLIDASTSILDDGDNTKILKFQASGISTGTTRTLTAPDASDTIVVLAASQSLTNKNLASSTNTLTGATAGSFTNTGTVTLPTSTTTLVGRDTTDALSNKTFSDTPLMKTGIALEETGAGTDIITVQAPSSIAASYTITLPVDDGTSGQFLQTDGSGVTTWANATGTSQDSPSDAKNYSFVITPDSPTSGDLTIALKDKSGSDPSGGSPVSIAFRNATAATGDYVVRSITSATSLTVPSGATLGHLSGQTNYIHIYAIDNAGTVSLAVSTIQFTDERVRTSATIGTGSDSQTGIYSDGTYSNKAVRLLARVQISETVAGTWSTAPTEISLGSRFDNLPIKYSPVVGASTTPPTFGTLSVNKAYFTVSGSRILINWDFIESSASGANDGSGEYVLIPPEGFTLNSNIYTDSNFVSNVGHIRIFYGGTTTYFGIGAVRLLSNSTIRFYPGNAGAGWDTPWGSAFLGPTAIMQVAIQLSIEVTELA